MQGFVYLVWVSIPITLFLLGLLSWGVQRFFPTEADDPNRPRRIFRTANTFGLFAFICVVIDQYLLSGFFNTHRDEFGFDKEALEKARIGLLPLLALIGMLCATARDILKPQGGFDKLRVDIRGSNPLLLVPALGFFALMVFSNPPENMPLGRLTSSPERPPQDTSEKPEGGIERIFYNIEQLSKLIREELGLNPPSLPPEVRVQKAPQAQFERPDYNPEAHLRYASIAETIAKKQGLDPYLVQALIEIGSGYNVSWSSREGAQGLMAISEETAKAHGAKKVYNPFENIGAGCRYLKKLLQTTKGDIPTALSLYRAPFKEKSEDPEELWNAKNADFVQRVLQVQGILQAKEGRM